MHSDALGEVARGLEIVDLACGINVQLKGELSTQVASRVDVASIRQPLGVVAGITPFNFPAMVPMWMFPIAIACGNTFVLKPSEKDLSASVRLAELLAEAGLPEGVFNVVHGDKVAVDRLLEHPDVKAVSFVGSTPIARYIHTTASANGKRVQALGGAKNHMLVLPDADLDAAADAAVSAAYGSAGERCMAISAVVAVGAIGDELVEKIRERAEKIKIGPGDDPTSEMGPLITATHRDKVASYVAGAADEGAEVVLDGTGYTVDGFENGHWIGISLLDKVPTTAKAYQDEIFGPVLCVLRADTYEEALDLINASPFGNGTAIFTRDGGAARRFQLEVEAGMVGVNVPIPVPVGYHSFGGWKDSSSATTTSTATTARTSTPAERSSPPAGPTRRTPSGVDLGFPATTEPAQGRVAVYRARGTATRAPGGPRFGLRSTSDRQADPVRLTHGSSTAPPPAAAAPACPRRRGRRRRPRRGRDLDGRRLRRRAPVRRADRVMATDDGVRIDTSFFTAGPEGRRPAVLLGHGFGGSKEDVRAQAEDLARDGYAVLTWSARGFGRSTGKIGLNDPQGEVADVSRLVDWLAARPEVRLDKAGDPAWAWPATPTAGPSPSSAPRTTTGSTP